MFHRRTIWFHATGLATFIAACPASHPTIVAAFGGKPPNHSR